VHAPPPAEGVQTFHVEQPGTRRRPVDVGGERAAGDRLLSGLLHCPATGEFGVDQVPGATARRAGDAQVSGR